MTVPLTERYFPPTPGPTAWSSFGEAVTVPGAGGGPGFTLISFLSGPLPLDSRLDYVVICHRDADEFRWSFGNPDTRLMSKMTSGSDPVANLTVPSAGPLRTDVVVRLGGTRVADLTLTQTVAPPSAAFTALEAKLATDGAGKNHLFSLREICEELRTYIVDAAAATDPNGIPARLLAAVLFRETIPRPKDGSPRAIEYRNELEGKIRDPRFQAILDKAGRAFGRKVRARHIDDIREEEIAMVRGFFNEAGTFLGDKTIARLGPKSVGVGQVAMTTAAMATGAITWQDLTATTRSTVLDSVEAAYSALTLDDRILLFNRLRFPKSNITIVAELLAKLKNRAHRFPTMTAHDLVGDETALGVLATEYNRGGYDTPTADFEVSYYGDEVVRLVLATEDIAGLSAYFPDPSP